MVSPPTYVTFSLRLACLRPVLRQTNCADKDARKRLANHVSLSLNLMLHQLYSQVQRAAPSSKRHSSANESYRLRSSEFSNAGHQRLRAVAFANEALHVCQALFGYVDAGNDSSCSESSLHKSKVRFPGYSRRLLAWEPQYCSYCSPSFFPACSSPTPRRRIR